MGRLRLESVFCLEFSLCLPGAQSVLLVGKDIARLPGASARPQGKANGRRVSPENAPSQTLPALAETGKPRPRRPRALPPRGAPAVAGCAAAAPRSGLHGADGHDDDEDDGAGGGRH